MAEELTLTPKALLEVAGIIHAQLQQLQIARYGAISRRIGELSDSIERLHSTAGRLRKGLDRRWMGAVRQVTLEVPDMVHEIPYQLGEIERALETSRKMELPPLGEILAELKQVKDEFGPNQVEYDRKQFRLTVVTEPIELEGYYLGEFEIRLELLHLSDATRYKAYTVVAIDPHPATSNDGVTHPHVSDDRLCEGEASMPITNALAAGRIADFFTLVRGVLTTYNPASPYVSLEDWEGMQCYDCGSTVGAGDVSYCESCDHDFCGECMSSCGVCDNSACRGCLTECRVCGELACSSCLTRCPDCNEPICKSCNEDDKCPCNDERKEQDHDESNESADTGREIADGERESADSDRETAGCECGGQHTCTACTCQGEHAHHQPA